MYSQKPQKLPTNDHPKTPQKLPTCINKNFRKKLWVRDLHDFFVFLPSPTDSFVFFFSYIKVEKNRVHRVPH